MKTVLIISCEHATYRIPADFKALFKTHDTLLQSHRGWDKGAYTLYQLFKKSHMAAYQQAANASRLLIDLNRSIDHPNAFSEITRPLTEEIKFSIIRNYYVSYRSDILCGIKSYFMKQIKVIHLSLHSFTPMLNGKIRNNDIKLLYNPERSNEVAFCKQFKKLMHDIDPTLTIRMNYPYRGTSDGLTTFLRTRFSNQYYVGVEVEMNQTHFDDAGLCKTSLVKNIKEVVNRLMIEYNH